MKIIKSPDVSIKNINIENVCKYQNEKLNFLALHKMEDSEYIQELIHEADKKIASITLTKLELEFSSKYTVRPFGQNSILIQKRM